MAKKFGKKPAKKRRDERSKDRRGRSQKFQPRSEGRSERSGDRGHAHSSSPHSSQPRSAEAKVQSPPKFRGHGATQGGGREQTRQELAARLKSQAQQASTQRATGQRPSRQNDFQQAQPTRNRFNEEHSLDRVRRREKKSHHAEAVIVHGEVQKNSRGFAFLLRKPEDLFISPKLAAKLLSGDEVKAWVDPRSKEVFKVETTKRKIKSFIGTYEAGFGQRAVILTDRTMREEVYIRERPNVAGLRDGDKVLVEIIKYEPHLEGKILKTFGAELAPQFDTLAVVVKSQWPEEFSEKAKEQAAHLADAIQKEAGANGYPGRKDLRQKPFVTIDGKDARDFDDAILVEKTSSGYVLYVAIADVAEFVRRGTALDDEAYARATSVYFPEWVIPMLPEALSNGACSLRPNEEKLTLTCEMHYDLSGKKRSAKIYESVIRSSRRCIYEDVQKEAEAGEKFWESPYELYKLIRFSRNKRGALDLDLPEAKVVLDEHSDTVGIKKVERVDAHRLIEEFMIAANESVTEIMEREGWPFIYRVHEQPQREALERFEQLALAFGLRPKLSSSKDPKAFSNFIESVKEHPMIQTISYLLLRSLKQARYEAVNLNHFGLASKAYTHFTSPIRRYPDLMVHRILKRFARHERFDEQSHADYTQYLVEACEFCSKQERKADDLERTVTKVKKARFMAKHMGEEFSAKITNVSESGVFIELEQWFVEGLLPIDELGNDYYEFFEEKLMLKGKRTGKKYRIGDALRVSVLRTDLDQGFIDFTLAENLIDAVV